MYTLVVIAVFSLGDVDASTEPRVVSHALRAGVAAAAASDWSGAQRAFEQAADVAPNGLSRSAASLGLAESLFRQGRYDEAAALFASWHASNSSAPSRAGALVAFRWAQCLAHQQRWHDCAEVAQQALANQTDPSLRIPLNYLFGRCHTAQGKHEAARAQYFVVARSPHAHGTIRARALWMIAHSYADAGEVEIAREAFLRIEKQFSEDLQVAAGALVQAGRCHEQRGEWEEAEATYRRAVEKYGNVGFSGEARRRLAVVQIRASQKR